MVSLGVYVYLLASFQYFLCYVIPAFVTIRCLESSELVGGYIDVFK